MPSQIQKRMEDMAGACLDTTARDDEAFNMEATQDRCILRLIASCCNGELVQSTNLRKDANYFDSWTFPRKNTMF